MTQVVNVSTISIKTSRYRLAQTLTCLLKQGPALLYSCETIIRHINWSTEELATFKKKLALIELYHLIEHSGIHCVGYRGADPRSRTLIQKLDNRITNELRSGLAFTDTRKDKWIWGSG